MDDLFQDYLCARGDVIDNAAYLLLNVMANLDEELEWDIGMIREVVESATAVLERHGIIACDPFYFDDRGRRTPCYQSDDCDGECPFKKGAFS